MGHYPMLFGTWRRRFAGAGHRAAGAHGIDALLDADLNDQAERLAQAMIDRLVSVTADLTPKRPLSASDSRSTSPSEASAAQPYAAAAAASRGFVGKHRIPDRFQLHRFQLGSASLVRPTKLAHVSDCGVRVDI